MADDFFSFDIGYSEASLPALSGYGADSAEGFGSGVLPSITGLARGPGAGFGSSFGIADTRIPALIGFSGTGVNGGAATYLPRIRGFASGPGASPSGTIGVGVCSAELAAIFGYSSGYDSTYGGGSSAGHGGGAGALPLLVTVGYAGWEQPSVSYGIGYLPAIFGESMSYPGWHGEGEGTISALRTWGVGNTGGAVFGASAGALPAIYGYGDTQYGLDEAGIWSDMFVSAPFGSGQILIAVVMDSTCTITDAIAVQVLSDAGVLSSATLTTPTTTETIMYAVMQSLLMAGFYVPAFDGEASVWVMNLDNAGTTRYEDYDFNSYAEIDGRYYGCKADGIYLLEGDTDAGDPIRASVDFGNKNFGSSALKACPNAYLGVSSSGSVYLKVTVEGTEYIYLARNSAEEMATRRVDLGKGIRANYLRFEIYNNEGCDMELDSVEFNVIPLSRRI